MRKVLFLCLAAAAAISFLNVNPAFGEQSGRARVMITAPVDENSRVVLEGNTRPEANAKNDRGIVEDSRSLPNLQLLLRRPAELETALQQRIEELHEPKSANYHK